MNAIALPLPTVRVVTAGLRRGGGRVRVERRDRGRAVQRVAIGRAVELHRLVDDAGARRRRGVDEQVGVRQRGRGVGQAEQAGQLLVGPHRDQVAAARSPRSVNIVTCAAVSGVSPRITTS